jgi:asparagine synthase (glutamine-hydrolysing)
MAHGVEIRTPLVDIRMLADVAPWMPLMTKDTGKCALAKAPSRPLPDAVVNRAKSGFGVPTGHWMKESGSGDQVQPTSARAKGLVSRDWARSVLREAVAAA